MRRLTATHNVLTGCSKDLAIVSVVFSYISVPSKGFARDQVEPEVEVPCPAGSEAGIQATKMGMRLVSLLSLPPQCEHFVNRPNLLVLFIPGTHWPHGRGRSRPLGLQTKTKTSKYSDFEKCVWKAWALRVSCMSGSKGTEVCIGRTPMTFVKWLGLLGSGFSAALPQHQSRPALWKDCVMVAMLRTATHNFLTECSKDLPTVSVLFSPAAWALRKRWVLCTICWCLLFQAPVDMAEAPFGLDSRHSEEVECLKWIVHKQHFVTQHFVRYNSITCAYLMFIYMVYGSSLPLSLVSPRCSSQRTSCVKLRQASAVLSYKKKVAIEYCSCSILVRSLLDRMFCLLGVLGARHKVLPLLVLLRSNTRKR